MEPEETSSSSLEDLSNDQLRKLLVKYSIRVPVTASTRKFLIKKLKLQMCQSGDSSDHASHTPINGTPEPSPPVDSRSSDSHGEVSVAIGTPERPADSSPYYGSKAEALKAVKGLGSGVRFKIVESPTSAKLFSLDTRREEQVQTINLISQSERANQFPSVKTPALNHLRQLIEEGRTAEFADTVWANPRHLITSGDTPEILHVGQRYNALHCAAYYHQLSVCKEVIAIVQSDQFWKLVYPDDLPETRERRRSHLIDMYLNMQDKTNNDTPLHIACRFGCEDIVAFLVTMPGINREIKNKYGETPSDVVCSRVNKSEPLVQRIRQLLKDPDVYYVPVIRAADNSLPPYLGSPCRVSDTVASPEQLEEGEEEEQRISNIGTSKALVSPVISHALAGPMSEAKALEFYKQWKSPTNSADRRQNSVIKRSDPDRGWERIGRSIAQSRGVGWTEYWEFLDCYCDLSQSLGLQRLENHLMEMVAKVTSPLFIRSTGSQPGVVNARDLYTASESPLTKTLATPSNDGVNTRTCGELCMDEEAVLPEHSDSSVKERLSDDLVSGLSRLSLRSSEEEQPLSAAVSPPVVGGFTTPTRGDRASYSVSPPVIDMYLTGLSPCKLDRDVFLALAYSDIDHHTYPYVHRWKQLIKSHPDEEQSKWRTPKLVRSTPRQHTDDLHRQSPLVFSTPPSPSPFSPSSRRPPNSRVTVTPFLRRTRHTINTS